MACYDITYDRLISILDYDPKTGIFKRNGVVLNTPKNPKRYMTIGIQGIHCYANVLAWFYVYKQWPFADVDHINGNRHDNRIANLREATRSQNVFAGPIRSDNKSGHRGVSWHKRAKKWRVQIVVNKQIHYLGLFECKELACLVYSEHAAKFYGAFYNPT